MTKRQLDNAAMISAVVATVYKEQNQPVWSGLKAFVDGLGELEANLSRISALLQVQEAKDGAADAKAAALKTLGDAAYEVAAATLAYASANNNATLAAPVNFTRAQITKGRGATVVARCRNVLAAATGVVDSLADQGVTPQKLAKFKQKIDAFENAQPQPRQAIASSSAATRELPTLFREAAKILEEQLDGLAVQFKDTQPAFYNEYQAARSVVDTGSHPAREEEAGANANAAATQPATAGTTANATPITSPDATANTTPSEKAA